MSVPTPPQALDGHCSTIDNEQLYVLSSGSFQSLPLKQGAQWNQEASGKSVKGAACAKVTGSDASQSALYVIGGTSDDSSYTGLQRYFFGNKTWETLSPPAGVLRNTLNASAVYIPDSNKILVYAGQPADQPSWLSSQTFTILAQAPYIIDSYISKGHTANLPILDRWNSSHAVMTGGSDIDASVMLFSPVDGWSMYPTGLSAPTGYGVKGALINGADGSKVLQTYDLTKSPNTVMSIELQGADGQPAQVGTFLGGSGKRSLSVASWPSYNSTVAPATARSDYSVATDGQGLVAFAGGSSSSPVALFNQDNNGWVDSNAYFNSVQTATYSSATSSATATATSTSASTSTTDTSAASSSAVGGVSAAVQQDAASRQHALLALELGVIIGVCGGLALLFLLVLLFLRWRKKRANDQYGEGGRMSFADRGASFMKEAEGSTHNFFPTADRYNTSSKIPPVAPGALRSSKFGGKLRFSGSGRSRNSHVTHHHTSSWESTKELVDKEAGYKEIELLPVNSTPLPVIRKPAPTFQSDRADVDNVLGMSPEMDDKERRKRSSGWSRYFNTSQPNGGNDTSHLPSAYNKSGANPYHNAPPSPSVYSQAAPPSDYGFHPVPALPQQDPVTVMPAHLPASRLMAPLNIDFTKTVDGQRLSKVASNPSGQSSSEELGRRGSLAGADAEEAETRPISTMTASSYATNTHRHTRSSIAASEYFANQHGINGVWTPMTTSFKDHVNNASGENSRRTSSMYTNSMYGDGRRKSAGGSWFPGDGSKRNSKSKAGATELAPGEDWDSHKDNLKFPPELRADGDVRGSNVTVFPEPMGDTYTASGKVPTQMAKPQVDGSGLAGLTSAANTSNMTLFPRAISMKQYPGVAKETEISQRRPNHNATDSSENTDVNWVNLGEIGAAK